MDYKDMSKHREGREQSMVVQTWLNEFKQSIMNNVIYRDSNPQSVAPEIRDAINNGSPETAEIVADTLIGWLNSPEGRRFASKAFGVEIPRYPDDGSE